MNTLRIALIVDHPLRDLSGLVLIARKLALSGARVFLVPMNMQEREIFTLRPDFVLLNYLRKNNENFVRKLQKAGIKFGILDTEGGFYGDLKNYANVLSYDSDLYKSVTCNLVWGQKMMDFWKADFPHKHPLVLTGLPRFDFYSEKLRKLNFDFISGPIAQKPFVLINTKVAVINPLFQSLEKEIELYRKLGVPEAKIQHYIEYGKYSIHDTVEFTKELSQQYPELNVLIRPHPHENHKTYENALPASQFPNVSVHREGCVTPWILKSRAMIHRHCTTAIEAALAEKTPIAPQWIRTSAEAPDAEAVSFRPESREELTELMNAVKKGEDIPIPSGMKQSLQEIIDRWLFQIDGESHSRAADAVLNAVENSRANRNDKICDQMALEIFANRQDLLGKTYHHFNKISGKTIPGVLWAVEKYRLRNWIKTQKYFTPEDAILWNAPLDMAQSEKLNISWARDREEYQFGFPGNSVLVEKN